MYVELSAALKILENFLFFCCFFWGVGGGWEGVNFSYLQGGCLFEIGRFFNLI